MPCPYDSGCRVKPGKTNMGTHGGVPLHAGIEKEEKKGKRRRVWGKRMGVRGECAPGAPSRGFFHSSCGRQRPQTREELGAWVRDRLGVIVPDRAVCPGHNSPMDYLWHAYGGDFSPMVSGRMVTAWCGPIGAVARRGWRRSRRCWTAGLSRIARCGSSAGRWSSRRGCMRSSPSLCGMDSRRGWPAGSTRADAGSSTAARCGFCRSRTGACAGCMCTSCGATRWSCSIRGCGRRRSFARRARRGSRRRWRRRALCTSRPD